MKTQHTEEELKAVELILTKPVFIGFSEETIRVRRNLLTLAFTVVFYKLSGVEINTCSFLGITFESPLDKEFLDTSMFCLVLYHFIHFVWQSLDSYKECKMRVTGTNELFMKNDNKKASTEDYALNPLQSSLLNWLWKRTELTTDDYYEEMKENSPVSANVLNAMTEENTPDLKKQTDALLNINTLNKAINDSRTLVSLRRFENFYKCFSWSQILRWYILELGAPVLLAILAMSQTYQPSLIQVLNFLCP